MVLAIALASTGCAGRNVPEPSPVGGAGEPLRVEAACGQCQFGMPGDDCELAVRIDGRVYFVDGTGIDDHGDAHAWDGFCNAIRYARVTGRIENGRFVATTFELVDENAED
jgi:hypothetical protein